MMQKYPFITTSVTLRDKYSHYTFALFSFEFSCIVDCGSNAIDVAVVIYDMQVQSTCTLVKPNCNCCYIQPVYVPTLLHIISPLQIRSLSLILVQIIIQNSHKYIISTAYKCYPRHLVQIVIYNKQLIYYG